MTPKKTDMTTNNTDQITQTGADQPDMNRRNFLTSTAAVGGAMVVGFWMPPSCADAAQAGMPATPGQHVPAQLWYRDALVPELNAWITIAPDDTVTIRINQTEIGTGVLTSNAMLVTEELQCDWSKVRVEYASANRNVREKAPAWARKAPGNDIGNIVGNQATEESGDGVYGRLLIHSSGNIRENKYYLQLIGAEARERLLHTAAAEWKVPVSELVAKDSVITHARSKRRTTYGAIASKAATMTLPYDPATIRIKTPDKWTLLGTMQKNRDMPLKVTGEAVFGSDVRLPGMLYASVKACPVWGGDVKSYNVDAIKSMPGVISVVRLPRNGPSAMSGGVAVVADSWWRAHKALEAMPIEWDYTGADATQTSETILAQHMANLKTPGMVMTNAGNVDAAFAGAAKIIESAYSLPFCSKARFEPGNATVLVTDNRVDVWAGTQAPENMLQTASKMTGVAMENVYLHLCFMGGGYGSDQGASPSQAVAVGMTLKGRPVQVRASRDEDWGIGTRFRPMGAGTFKAALDAQGWPIAVEVHSTGADYAGDQQIRGLTAPPYFMPNYRYTFHPIKQYVPANTRRATGASPNCFYMESFFDELAHAAGKDPYQYRRELISRNPIGKPGVGGFNRRTDWLTALDVVAKMSNWGAPLPEGWARGIAIEDRRRPSRPHSTIGAEVVTIEISKRGQLRWHRADVAFERGYGHVHPMAIQKQIEGQMSWAYDEAVHQASTVKDGRCVEHNVDTFPISRMNEYPREVNIQYFPTKVWVYGAGEEVIPQIPPAIYNAVFKITGKRFRTLPLKNHDLSWG
jgi:isoquinoline 1-oxidoreductase beta subunit